jgi:hypothetical protein
MKQIVDRNGSPLKGLYKKDDRSIVVVDKAAFMKSRMQHDAFDSLQSEVNTLKKQMQKILEHINGKN